MDTMLKPVPPSPFTRSLSLSFRAAAAPFLECLLSSCWTHRLSGTELAADGLRRESKCVMEFASLLQLRLKGWLARETSRDLSCRGSRVGDQKERGFNFKESKSFGSQVSVRVRERGREKGERGKARQEQELTRGWEQDARESGPATNDRRASSAR